MNTFSICMPCGQISIVMSIPKLMNRIAHNVIQGEEIHYAASPTETIFHGRLTDGINPVDKSWERRILPMKQTADFHRIFLQHRNGNHELIVEAMNRFMTERFKEHVSKKKIEFYIPDLTLQSVEELGIKYMENMGSEDGTLCIFKLSDFHKFAALVDHEAFQLYRNDKGTHAELAELRPDKWVLGRYDNDMKIIHEMEGMRRYSPGTNTL